MSSTNPTSTSAWEPPSPERLQAMLPQYEISGILGRGGMGAVYKGCQTNLERDVAIKVLPETFSEGDDELNFVARFRQEAKAMAKLDHPDIISVFDFGETAEGQLYFVMEFVDGMDIHQYLHSHGGKLPQEQALAIVAHVLDALEYAHGHGIVHRDIKPANILLNREGRVKIADFGLAKKFGEAADPSAPMLTMSNVAVGTPDFVAPEALDPDATPDHRADLYAVGVMLYQLLTGRIPRGIFQSPSEIDAELDPRLDDIVSKAMASNPDYRYASASAVRADLDAIFSQPLAKVEAGEASAAVAAAVPATSSVRGEAGKGAAKASKPSPAMVYGGVAVAAAVAVGLLVLGMSGGKEPPPAESGMGILPMASTEQTPEPEPSPIAPAPETTDTASPPAEPAPEPEAAPVAPPALAEAPPAEAPPAEAPEPATATVAEAPAPPTADSQPPTEQPPTADSQPPTEQPPTADSPPPTEQPPTEQPPTEAPNQEPSTKNQELFAVPGLAPRLDAYLAARRTQTAELAERYLRGLEPRFNQAADSGDLALSSAYQEEKDRLAALREALAEPAADPVAAVAAAESLPELPGDAPEALATLRGVWDGEYAKIREDLDGRLAQSLQALEAELTRERDLEGARAVLAYREGLGQVVEQAVASAPPAPAPATAPASPAQGGDSDLARATKDAPFENSLGMKFVPVPGTDVLFCIHEVRYKDYEEYARRSRGSVDGSWKTQTNDGFEIKRGGGDHPVTRVRWEDAQKFCAWLSEKEGRTYRLPTDREWSIAVGIGDYETWEEGTTPETVSKPGDIFPWGKEWPPPAGAGNYSDESRRAKAPREDEQYLEGYEDGFPTTAPVMSFEPNEHGLYDMGGNVWEWVEDWYSDEQKKRVRRGASWTNNERGNLLSSFRNRYTPENRHSNIGFRLVLVSASGR